MTGEVRRAAREAGWSHPSHLTFRAVTGWLGSHKDWAPTTHDRALSVFKSFARWLEATEILDADPLRRAERTGGEGGPGTRAASVDEARAIVRAAWVREQTDGRARRSARALYWHCLFACGCRVSEPAGWTWDQMLLDEPIPCILWTPSSHKAARRQETALAPESVELLRLWREASGGKGKVFPSAPSRNGFAADRDRAGIPRLDQRGRPLSAHSARKFLSTHLTVAGVSPRIVDKILRHAGGTEARYVDEALSDQADALKMLPSLWPETIGAQTFRGLVQKNPGARRHNGLTEPGWIADTPSVKANPMLTTTTFNSHSETRPADGGHGLDNLSLEAGRVSLCDLPVGTSSEDQVGNGHVVPGHRDALNIAVADLLEAAARVIREGGRDANR